VRCGLTGECRKGDVYWVDWEPARGVEQRGRRPALIVQNDVGNRSAPSTVIAAISSAPIKKAYPFVVCLPLGEANLSKESFVNCAQLLTIDQGRLLQKLGRLSPQLILEVDKALAYQLGLKLG
jgi:mRNA interferase MazF